MDSSRGSFAALPLLHRPAATLFANVPLSLCTDAGSGGLHTAAAHVRDEWIDPFVIAGTERECAEALARLVEQHDVEEFLLPVFDMPDSADYVRRVAAVLEAM